MARRVIYIFVGLMEIETYNQRRARIDARDAVRSLEREVGRIKVATTAIKLEPPRRAEDLERAARELERRYLELRAVLRQEAPVLEQLFDFKARQGSAAGKQAAPETEDRPSIEVRLEKVRVNSVALAKFLAVKRKEQNMPNPEPTATG
jgi:hypothetical protein